MRSDRRSHAKHWKRAGIAGVLTLSVWLGVAKAQSLIHHWTRPVRSQLESSPPRITGRDAIKMPAGTCIVFQIPPIVPLSGSQSLDDLDSWLPGYETGSVDPRDEIYREPEGSYWYDDLHDVDQCIPTFNCVTYAVGESAGLTIADYVPTSAGDATEGTHPVRVILESYYVRRESWDPALRPWNEFESDSNFAEGDVVCFVNESRQDFVHMTRVSKVEGKNRLVGKLGAGPVVRTSPDTIAAMYQGTFDRVEVYRRK